MGDERGLEIDLHPITPSDDGGGHQALPDGGSFYYPAPVAGRIAGRVVHCVDAVTQVNCHVGYEPSDKDRRDMALLHAATAVALPSEFQADDGLRSQGPAS